MVRVGWIMGGASFVDFERKNTEQKICPVYRYGLYKGFMIVCSLGLALVKSNAY